MNVFVIVLIWVCVAAFWGWITYKHVRDRNKPKLTPQQVTDHKLIDFFAQYGVTAIAVSNPDGSTSYMYQAKDKAKVDIIVAHLEMLAASRT